MNRLFIIFVVLFLASCQEDTIPEFQCGIMTFSDALPVQFWQTGCNTYNQTVPKGVHEKCWCAPWQCDDQLRIQFQEAVSPDIDYFLAVKDTNDEYLASLKFEELTTGVHAVAFSPETEGICSKLISLEIANADSEEILSNTSFTSTLDPWTDDGSPDDWAWDAAGVAEAQFSGPDEYTSNLVQTFATQTAGPYIMTYYASGPTIGDATFIAEAYMGGVLVKELINTQIPAGVSSSTALTSFAYVSSSFDRIKIRVKYVVFHSTFNLHSFSLRPANILAYSDCLDIKLAHDETELIEYSNARNFAGLIHSDISPDATFNIRVPCRFFHETFPEEDEAIELTSSVITTSGQLKSQKLLEVQHVPYYFHKKLQLILKHHTLTINGTEYQKEEKYEIIEGNKQWPLKAATCLLTEKNSVLRNVI